MNEPSRLAVVRMSLAARARSWSQAAGRRQESGPWTFTLVAATLFAAAEIALHARHEFWRDEIHCWSLARNAGGLWDLLTGDRRYDGHPFLWYWLLHLVSRVTRDPVGLHVVAIAANVAAAVLWLRCAPLPRWLRLLLLLAYDFAYEYGAMSRAYSVGVLLTFSFCALYDRTRVRYLPLGIILALLAATSMYGTILSLVLGLFLFSRGVVVAPHPRTPDPWSLSLSLSWLGGALAFTGGLILVALTTMPPSDAYYGPGWTLSMNAEAARAAAERYWWGMFPARAETDAGWIVASYLGQHHQWFKPVLPVLVAAMVSTWLLAMWRAPRILLAALMGTALMALAQQAVNGGWLRHWGHHLILMIASVWLLARETRLRARMAVPQGLLALVLVAQAITGVRAFYLDWQQPFSGALDAARFIAGTGRRNLPIVGDADHPASAVAGYLDRTFAYAQTGDMGATVVFHNQRHDPSVNELVEQARGLASRAGGVALIVTNHDLGSPSVAGVALTLLHHTPPALVTDEEFRVYEVRVAGHAVGCPMDLSVPREDSRGRDRYKLDLECATRSRQAWRLSAATIVPSC